MVQVKTKQEHEMQELICVLFSETLQRALRLSLLEQDQVDYYDPALMFSIPRLAIVAGLVIYPRGPLNMSMPADQLSEMFRPFRTLLIKIRDLLRTLNSNELFQLEKLLCTNEDIHIIQEIKVEEKTKPPPSESVKGFKCDENDDDEDDCDDDDEEEDGDDDDIIDDDKLNPSSGSSSNSSVISRSSSSTSNNSSNIVKISSSGSSTTISTNSETELDKNVINQGDEYSIVNSDSNRNRNNINCIPNNDFYAEAEVLSDATPTSTAPLSVQPNIWANTSVATSAAAASTRFIVGSPVEALTPDDPASEENVSLVTADCASGYLIPNTNFGNLLQTTDTPLTDSFISSDDEYSTKLDKTITNDDEDEDDSAAALAAAVAASASISSIVNATNVNGIDNPVSDLITCTSNLNNFRTSREDSDNNADSHHSMQIVKEADSGFHTAENTSLDHTPDSETNNLIGGGPNATTAIVDENQQVEDIKRLLPTEVHSIILPVLAGSTENGTGTEYTDSNVSYKNQNGEPNQSKTLTQVQRHHSNRSRHSHHHHHHHRSHQREKCDKRNCNKHRQSSLEKSHANSTNSYNTPNIDDLKTITPGSSAKTVHARRRSTKHTSFKESGDMISTSSTSSMYSDGESKDVSLALRTAGRMKFK